MSRLKPSDSIGQLPMVGVPAAAPLPPASCCTVAEGQRVVYIGSVGGGPRYGVSGVVKSTRRHKAVVELAGSGTWHVPYYLLTLPRAA